jgi:hypothetical protein
VTDYSRFTARARRRLHDAAKIAADRGDGYVGNAMKAAISNAEFRCRLVFFPRGAGVGLQVNIGRKMVGSVFMNERNAVELRRQINNAINTCRKARGRGEIG